jgi:ubiquinone/menaquinone biosynthesis C-methylase UbiE
MTGEESRTGGEYLTTEKAIKNLPHFEKFCKVKIERIRRVTRLQEKLKILELGCSIGGTVVAWRNLGFECIGLEPSSIAVQNSLLFSEKIGIAVPVKQGVAEEIPFENDTFDFVNANSVIEHVQNVELAIKEIYRVLKPDGVFWFNAASSMCPLQDEIRGFPLFGWYPQVIKLRILNWVKVHRPELIG